MLNLETHVWREVEDEDAAFTRCFYTAIYTASLIVIISL